MEVRIAEVKARRGGSVDITWERMIRGLAAARMEPGSLSATRQKYQIESEMHLQLFSGVLEMGFSGLDMRNAALLSESVAASLLEVLGMLLPDHPPDVSRHFGRTSSSVATWSRDGEFGPKHRHGSERSRAGSATPRTSNRRRIQPLSMAPSRLSAKDVEKPSSWVRQSGKRARSASLSFSVTVNLVRPPAAPRTLATTFCIPPFPESSIGLVEIDCPAIVPSSPAQHVRQQLANAFSTVGGRYLGPPPQSALPRFLSFSPRPRT